MIEDYNKLNEILPSKTWCPQILTGLSVQCRGLAPCCEYTNPIDVRNIKDYKNHPRFKEMKHKMENNEWDDGCFICKQREEHGEISQRMKEVYNQIRPFNLDDFQLDLYYDLFRQEKYLWLNFHPSNKCNLACIMCYPGASSKLEQEVLDNPDHWMTIPKKLMKHEDLTVFADNIHPKGRIYISGGEPSVMAGLVDFIKTINLDTHIEFNSNFNVYNAKLWDSVFKFKGPLVMASIDAIGKRAEYIRYGCNWNQVEKNILRFRDSMHDNVDFKITPAIGIYNLFYFDELVEWVNKHGLNMMISNIIKQPYYFSISHVLHETKKEYFTDIFKKSNYKPLNDYLLNDIDTTIKSINNAKFNRFEFNNLIDRLNRIDKIRNVDWKKVFPKLDEYINYVMEIND